MTSVVGTITKSPTLSGTTWPINYAAVGAGQVVAVFIAMNRKTYPVTMPGDWTVKVNNEGHSLAPTAGAIYYKAFPSGAAAGSVNGTFSTSNEGHAFSVVLTDAQFDVVSASGTEVTAGGVSTSTVAAITGAAASSIYLNFVIAEFYRTFTHSGGFTATDQIADFVPTANGGVSSALGYKTSGSGSTTGGTWTSADPYGGAPGARSQTWAIIFKPSTAPTNPTATGDIYAPDETASAAPNNPPSAPVVTVTNSDEVGVTLSGYDVTADTLYIMAAKVVGGVPGADVIVKTMAASGATFPTAVTGLDTGATYRFGYFISRSGQSSALSSPQTANVKLKDLYCYLFTDVSALGVAGVDAQVFRSPAAGFLAGESIGKASALTFDATAVSGRARLRIPLVQPTTGAKLRNGNTVSAVARKISGAQQTWTRITSDAQIAEV